jgi:hypothetical protein
VELIAHALIFESSFMVHLLVKHCEIDLRNLCNKGMKVTLQADSGPPYAFFALLCAPNLHNAMGKSIIIS